MRDIKFRAWDKNLKNMLVIFDSTTGANWFLPDINENFEIMQYTGLKDKYEEEIYEGDIIEGGYLNPLTNEFLSRKYIVEYGNAHFKGTLIGHAPYGDTWLEFIKGEIIGNIYENTELFIIQGNQEGR